MSEMDNTRRTYFALLLLPHNALRARLQAELVACREAVALMDDREPQEVQDECEAIAKQISEWLPLLVKNAKIIVEARQ